MQYYSNSYPTTPLSTMEVSAKLALIKEDLVEVLHTEIIEATYNETMFRQQSRHSGHP